MNGTHQVLAYADDTNLIGGDIRTIERNADVLLHACNQSVHHILWLFLSFRRACASCRLTLSGSLNVWFWNLRKLTDHCDFWPPEGPFLIYRKFAFFRL